MGSHKRGVLQEGRFGFAGRTGQSLADGYFWTQRAGGYAFYLGVDSPAEVDFSHPAAVCGPAVDELQLPVFFQGDGDYHLVCKTVSRFGIESDASASLRIRTDQQNNGFAVPGSPHDLTAAALSGSRVMLRWRYEGSSGSAAVSYFKLFSDGGLGQVDYGVPLAQVDARPGERCYRWISWPLRQGQPYKFAVRAYSADDMSDDNARYVQVTLPTTGTAAAPQIQLSMQDS